MPILLTTPWDPGQFDPGNTYPRAKILGFGYEEAIGAPTPPGTTKRLTVEVDFGDVVDSEWVSGDAPNKRKSFMIVDGEGTELTDLMSTVSTADETAYALIKRAIYAYLTANVAELAGTVE